MYCLNRSSAIVAKLAGLVAVAIASFAHAARADRLAMVAALPLVTYAIHTATPQSAAEEPPPQSAKSRLESMQAALGGLLISSTEIKSPDRLRFGTRPLLRYNDQTRGLLDAAIWRLSEQGRPLAFVTLELYESGNNAEMLSYELVSLTNDGFKMQSARGIKWSPHSTDLTWASLSDAAAPAPTARARLAQFRQVAQRFSAREKLADEAVECRLLPQPIDRYSDAGAGIVDGAVFAFANGTNPEVGLMLECTAEQWSYGAFRLSSAEIAVSLDGKAFFTVEQVNSLLEPSASSYRALRQPVRELQPPPGKR